MTSTPSSFRYSKYVHSGPGAEIVLAESTIQGLLAIGSDLIVDLVDLYLKDAAERIQVTVEAFDSADPAAVGRATHALKSASANLGALNFSAVCGELERLGWHSNLESMKPWIGRLQSMHVEVEEALVALRRVYNA